MNQRFDGTHTSAAAVASAAVDAADDGPLYPGVLQDTRSKNKS